MLPHLACRGLTFGTVSGWTPFTNTALFLQLRMCQMMAQWRLMKTICWDYLQVAQGQMDGLSAAREQLEERLEQQILATRRTVQDHASQAATVSHSPMHASRSALHRPSKLALGVL